MALRDLRRNLRSDGDQLDRERLRRRFGGRTPTIADVPSRTRAAVAGEVRRIRITPRRGVPSLEIVVGDGTADLVAVFTGRRGIAGLELGRAVIVEGVTRDERGRRVMLNPSYTLLPH